MKRGPEAALSNKHGPPRTSPDRLETQASIEIQAAPGEKVVFDDELRGVRDFIGLAQSLERNRRDDLLEHFGLHRGEDIGVRKARRDGGYAYPIARKFLCPHDSHGGDARLGGRVVRLAGVPMSGNARNVDDDAALGELDHAFGRFPPALNYA